MGYKITRNEKDIQLSILHYLRNIGAYAGKVKVSGQVNLRKRIRYLDPWVFKGFPDLCVFHKNKMWFLEVKREDGVLSDYQKNFQLLCKQSGISYSVVRSLDDVVNVIN